MRTTVARIPPSLREPLIWLVVLGVGVLLIHERFDWGVEGGRFAERAFVLSSYLFAILLPTCFYLARRLLHSGGAATAVTAVAFILTTAPYELLGLDDLFYYADHPRYFGSELFPRSLEFFPEGTLRAFPGDWVFMPLLFLTGAGLVWGIWGLRRRAGIRVSRKIPALLTIVFAAICIQAFAHSSMRAPYTYLSYFQRPEAVQNWYHVYHFEDGTGASEADQFVFTPIEEYFQAAPVDGNNELIRRPFSFYLAAQVSYFVNTYYVWLALNCLFWLAAVVATARLVGRLTSERAGLIAGALTTVSPGFIAFVATPAMYMQSYAAVAIALCLFEDLVVRPRARDVGRVALFTGALALCLLVYDLTPLVLVLLAYGLARRLPFWTLLSSLLVAFLAARTFPYLVTGPLGIPIEEFNEQQLTKGLDRTKDFLLHPNLARWYDATVTITPSYVRMLLQSCFVIPVVVALFGIGRLKDTAAKVLVAGLVLMTFATVAVLQIGEIRLIDKLPRLVFLCFPAIYLLAAVALDREVRFPRVAGSWVQHRLAPRLSAALPWAVIAVMAVLVNVDIFGHPSQYVQFFISNQPVFTP